MSDETEISSPPPAANAPVAPAVPTPPPLRAAVAVYALNHPTRLTVVRALAGGSRMSIVQLAALTNQPPDQVAKHLKILRNAGILVAARRESDTRQWDHEIPAGYRVTDAAGQPALDFGSVLLRLAQP